MERDTFYDPIEIHVCPTCGGIVKEPIKAKVPDQPEFNKTVLTGTCCENGTFDSPHECRKQKLDHQPVECTAFDLARTRAEEQLNTLVLAGHRVYEPNSAFWKAAEAVAAFRSKNGTHWSWEMFQVFLAAYVKALPKPGDSAEEIEHVAMALFNNNVHTASEGIYRRRITWQELAEGGKEHLRNDAKAAIAAMSPKRESGCLLQSDNKKSCVSEIADGEKLQNIGEVAIQHGLIDSPTAFAHRDKIEAALRTISDEGKSDAGIGFGGFDFWIKLQGIEYYFNVKPKITQIEDQS